ncbi:hypothetical protein SCAR479_09213 [Seiridium cardinale]|uniref:Uncharacterized protein n=1 Tax=Seiridium cardinale TaxID=138064 RepID=A0ABR2XK82_9PEZI
MASRQLRPTTAQHANGKGYLLQSGRDKTARWQTHVDTFASGKYEEVDDNRVQHIHLSLGTRMQRRVGLQPDGTFTNPAYPILERLYYKYQWSEEFTKDYVASFTAETGLLVRDTISDATALCSTVSRAADSLVTGAYGALTDLILVDEASKIAEYEGWPWIAFYRGAIGKLMIGDIDQLQPSDRVITTREDARQYIVIDDGNSKDKPGQEPEATVMIRNAAVWLALCSNMDTGFAESYKLRNIEADSLLNLFLVSIHLEVRFEPWY